MAHHCPHVMIERRRQREVSILPLCSSIRLKTALLAVREIGPGDDHEDEEEEEGR